jgi:uncharacterized membrane protein YeiH
VLSEGSSPAFVPMMIHVLDLAGTFVFAVSGAMLGIERRLDLFGVLVLAFVTAFVGGITRDVLIGAVPPETLYSWHGFAIVMMASVTTLLGQSWLRRLNRTVLLFDALGLGLFAVTGTQKAIAYGLDPLMAAILGMISGIGGGVVRDILVTRTPTVLQSDIYALAALAGGLLMSCTEWLRLPATPAMLIGLLLCVALRLMAVYRGWTLPTPKRIRPGG